MKIKDKLEKIKDLIKDKIKNSEYKGRNYYYYKPKIENISGTIDTSINNKIKPIKLNSQLFVYTNYFKMLVDQKIDYLLAREPVFEEGPEEFNVTDILDKSLLESSIDSIAWLYFFINIESKLDWMLIPDMEIIPIYDQNNKYLQEIIRFNETEDKKFIKIQIWNSEGVIFFEFKKDDKNELIMPELKGITYKPHYEIITKYENEEEDKIEGANFGFIPFIPLFNNKSHVSDLEQIEELCYYYNQISSGFIDNIFKFQEFLLVLKGLGGQDIEELMKKLKKFKGMDVPEGGDANYLSVEIPVEARTVILDILKKNIFLLGRGVDLNQLIGIGSQGNLTNVLIKALYAYLDMKANDTEKQLKLFYKQIIKYINQYYNLQIDDEIKFNRSMIFNESEQIENCVKSMGIISKKTILGMHPNVTDVDEEMKLLEEEEEAYKLELERENNGEEGFYQRTGQNNSKNNRQN